MTKHVILKEHKTFIEDGELYLRLIYEYEDVFGLHKLMISKIKTDFREDYLPPIVTPSTPLGLAETKIAVGNHRYDFCLSGYEIEDRPKEMTLSEIEKKLGYKVKLVGEDAKNE